SGGVVTTWEGGDARGGGRIIAAGDPRLHGAPGKVLSRSLALRITTPGMKASNAAQNCSRIESRSCRISWREALMTICDPALSLTERSSIAGLDTIWSSLA